MPPTDLGIEDAKPHTAKRLIAPPPPSASDPMQMMQQIMGMFMGGLTSPVAISHSPPSEQHSPGPPVPPSPPTGLKHPVDNDLLPKNIDIEVWVAQLDSDPVHSKWQIDCSKFGAWFTALGIYELSGIIVLDVLNFKSFFLTWTLEFQTVWLHMHRRTTQLANLIMQGWIVKVSHHTIVSDLLIFTLIQNIWDTHFMSI